MYKDKLIGVVVPAHNEEEFVGTVIDTIPDYIDRIYAVNDCSTDKTLEIILRKSREDDRVIVIDRRYQGGVGASILSGHMKAIQDNMDILVVMAGDGQMPPEVLYRIIDPVAEGRADYSKGDRLSKRENQKEMPLFRFLGNLLLTSLTRLASGYWHVSDPQNGYTAISVETLKKLALDKIERGFAFENDMLVKLNVVGARVKDVPHPAIYRGQHSKIRYFEFIVNTSWILLRGFFWRIWVKYIIHKHALFSGETRYLEL